MVTGVGRGIGAAVAEALAAATMKARAGLGEGMSRWAGSTSEGRFGL